MDPFENLMSEIDKKVTQLSEWISGGQAKDFGDYQKTCGEIRGLLLSRQYITDLKQRLEHSDND
jgi:hypothetical protein